MITPQNKPANTPESKPADTDQIIDQEGYRLNVGIVLLNPDGKVFWARSIGRRFWQFPQGGISPGETPEQALYRELEEEVGLKPEQVEVIGCTENWLHYDLPERFIRRHQTPLCIGQKQMWFGLRILVKDSEVCFNTTNAPEFDHFRWVNYWSPIGEVVFFKRGVYKRALNELAPKIFPDGAPKRPKPIRRGAFGRRVSRRKEARPL